MAASAPPHEDCCSASRPRSCSECPISPLKYLTGALHGGLRGIVSEWTLAALAASVLAFYASARGLQLGPGVTVIAFTSVAANLAAIIGGILGSATRSGSVRWRSSDA
jgi:hypothetical protein